MTITILIRTIRPLLLVGETTVISTRCSTTLNRNVMMRHHHYLHSNDTRRCWSSSRYSSNIGSSSSSSSHSSHSIEALSSWNGTLRPTTYLMKPSSPLLRSLLLYSKNDMSHPYFQQVRWKGRNDGNRYSKTNMSGSGGSGSTTATNKYTTRKSIKKQQKKYHRKLQQVQLQKYGRHNPPGSKATLKRQYIQREQQDILASSSDPTVVPLDAETVLSQSESQRYTSHDALLEDLMGNVHQMTPTPEPLYIAPHSPQSQYYYNQVVDQMEEYHIYQAAVVEAATQPPFSLESSDASTTATTTTAAASNTINSTTTINNSTINTTTNLPKVDLPTDEMISKALRAYRDRHGTQRHTMGIIKALQHLLYDLQVPIAAIGEYTYTTLLTCCRTPTEGRRVLQMIREQGLPVSSYSYSILCHLHAKMGDYQGCINVQQEMLQDKISPTLASYTSLLAACYKICHNGRISHRERTIAAQVGWEKWQEMRIIGIEPDVMAYGAILRIKAARGKAEECINLLNEMFRFEIYPTTLCYTTALRAVARSHAIAIRYEKGISPRNRRREMITTHHGKLTRHIVVLAESANIVKDEGFISALCLCAGTAGDIATVKAIAMAYDILITQHDHLRTIGSDEHLQRLRQGGGSSSDKDGDSHGGGYNLEDPNISHQPHLYNTNGVSSQLPLDHPPTMSSSSMMMEEPIIGSERYNEYNTGHATTSMSPADDGTATTLTVANGTVTPHQQQQQHNHRHQRYIPSFGEREYGKDNRLLSSIIHACAQAADPNMMGTIWQGRENKGYLCINSLRLISQPKIPQYTDTSIPGQTITDNLKLVREERDDGYREGKRNPRKFAGVDIDENVAGTFDELLADPDLSRRYINADGRRKFEYRKITPEEVWKLKYGTDWDKEEDDTTETDTTTTTKSITASNSTGTMIPDNNDQVKDEMIHSYLESFSKSEDNHDNMHDANQRVATDDAASSTTLSSSSQNNTENPVGDIYFDYGTMRWKPKTEQKVVPTTTTRLDNNNNNNIVVPSTSPINSSVDNVNVVDEPSVTSTEEELYFDTDIMRWKTRPKTISTTPPVNTKTPLNIDHKKPDGTLKVKNDRDESREDESDQDDDEEDDDEEDWETASDDSDEDEDYVFDKERKEWVVRSTPKPDGSATTNTNEMVQETNDDDENFEAEFFYDETDEEWKTKSSTDTKDSTIIADTKEVAQGTDDNNFEAEFYYDEKSQEWKTKNADNNSTTKVIAQKDAAADKNEVTTKPDVTMQENSDTASIAPVIDQAAENEEAFAIFYSDLRKESLESEQEDVTEEEARELFDMMKDEYNEMIVLTPEQLGLENHPVVVEQKTQTLPKDDETSASDVVQDNVPTISHSFNEEASTSDLVAPLPLEKSKSATRDVDIPADIQSVESFSSSTPQQSDTVTEKFWDDTNYGTTTQTITLDPVYDSYSYSEDVNAPESSTELAFENARDDASRSPSLSVSQESALEGTSFDTISKAFEMFNAEKLDEDYQLTRLRELLPHFSDRRLIKIVKCYHRSLGDPSLLELVPIVRENMPDYITSTWLKQMATLTASSAIQKAAQNELLNTEILNSVLELHTSSGSLDRAILFHQTEFAAQNLEPTEYSDRLVVQMLLRNTRFNRALAFKQTVENSGRSLDIKAYGSLVEFCARRKQLGSAMLLLKECLSIHGAPPSEASLSNLRLLCRQAGIENEIGLESMIGKDPVEWLRHGERELKREYSKKGRRDVQMGRNAMVRL